MKNKSIQAKILQLLRQLYCEQNVEINDAESISRLIWALANPNIHIASKAAWALKEIGPNLEQCQNFPTDSITGFVRAYLNQIEKELQLQTAPGTLTESFDTFLPSQAEIAAAALLRHLLVGKSGESSILKRVVCRMAQMTLEWTIFHSPIDDDKLIVFIRQNVRKIYQEEQQKDKDEFESAPKGNMLLPTPFLPEPPLFSRRQMMHISRKSESPKSPKRFDAPPPPTLPDTGSIPAKHIPLDKAPLPRGKQAKKIYKTKKDVDKSAQTLAGMAPGPLEDFFQEQKEIIKKKIPAKSESRARMGTTKGEQKPKPRLQKKQSEDRRKARKKKSSMKREAIEESLDKEREQALHDFYLLEKEKDEGAQKKETIQESVFKEREQALHDFYLLEKEKDEGTQTMPAEKICMSKKASPLLLLTLPFKVLSLPFVGIAYLAKGIYSGLRSLKGKLAKLRTKSLQKLREKAAKAHVPVFELFLSDDAGQPGSVERLTAQSTLLMRSVQITIGLKFIVIANALDMVLDVITAYVNGIFRSWKMLKTAKRRMARSGNLAIAVAEDLAFARFSLSRLLCFCGFYPEHCLKQSFDEKIQKAAISPTFALKLALEIRGHLDEMKRDLSMLTSKQIQQFVQGSLKDLLVSFIPNPLDLLAPCKDLFVLIFFMKYSRQEIEEMYANLLLHYSDTITLLGKEEAKKHENNLAKRLKWMEYETKMIKRLQISNISTENLEESIEDNRRDLQRLIQMLCIPEQFINPRRWHRADLLREANAMWQTGKLHPQYVLELDRWLTREIKDTLRKEGLKGDLVEQQLRLAEARNFRHRYRLQQHFGKRFIVL